MLFEEFIKGNPIQDLDAQGQAAALAAMGADAAKPLDRENFDAVARQVGYYARSLKGLGVDASVSVERQLLLRAGVTASRIDKEFKIGNALGVIAARGYLRAALVFLGFDWSNSMVVQSSCGELCRFASAFNEAVLHIRVGDQVAEVAVRAPGLTRAGLEAARAQLGGLFDQAGSYRVMTTVNGQEFVFGFEPQVSRGNAA